MAPRASLREIADLKGAEVCASPWMNSRLQVAGAGIRFLMSARSRRDTPEEGPSRQAIQARIPERRMPLYHRTYSPGELQFITTSTYRRAPVFLSPRFCHYFVERVEEVRQKMHCLLIGWVLMPEHFHRCTTTR